MAGVVSYQETGIDDIGRSYSHPFRAPIELAIDYPHEIGVPTGGLSASASYLAVLKTEGADYVVEAPVSHSLASGEADRLLLALPADVSTHDFRVSLLSSIGSVDCGAVRLETFATLKRAGSR
jgi:hypothetical protein